MVIPVLIALVLILGVVVSYVYLIAPRLNPANRAEEYLSQNRIEDAIEEYRKLLDNDPLNPVVNYRLGNLYFRKNEVDQGVIHYEQVLNSGKFSHEVDRYDVMRKLGRAYVSREQLDRAFQAFFEISRAFPADEEALYHIAFISLGQEMFEFSLKYFEKLLKASKSRSFEVLFGAGITSFMNQKLLESIEYFRESASLNSSSEIANISAAFALNKKRDFSNASSYARKVADGSGDINAALIGKRLLGIILFQWNRAAEAMSIYEELLNDAVKAGISEDIEMYLYDIGFIAIAAEKTEMAYEYWNQLYQRNRSYKKIQILTTLLRKEMEADGRLKKDSGAGAFVAYSEEWIRETFPEDFIWDICGLKSAEKIDLRGIIGRGKQAEQKTSGQSRQADVVMPGDDVIERLYELDTENFRIIAGRVVQKLGYTVDDILPTYKESDGVDFLARSSDGKNTALVWVRRWKGLSIGEIPLRNFAQAINDIKAKEGYFITSGILTPTAESSLQRLKNVKVIYPEQFGNLLQGLL